MIKNTRFVYICADCGTAYYNSIAAKCCCTDTCKNSLSNYICSDNNDGVRVMVEKNKAVLIDKI